MNRSNGPGMFSGLPVTLIIIGIVFLLLGVAIQLAL